jgi:hypothetical protein
MKIVIGFILRVVGTIVLAVFWWILSCLLAHWTGLDPDRLYVDVIAVAVAYDLVRRHWHA